MAGSNKPYDPHSYENYGWGTPISEFPIYKGSVKRPLKATDKWRHRAKSKPIGFNDTATELRNNYTYSHFWRTLDVWNFKSKWSAHLRGVFFKFGLTVTALFFISAWGPVNRYKNASHPYERNPTASPLYNPLSAFRPNRESEHSAHKDMQFTGRFGQTTTEELHKQNIDLQ